MLKVLVFYQPKVKCHLTWEELPVVETNRSWAFLRFEVERKLVAASFVQEYTFSTRSYWLRHCAGRTARGSQTAHPLWTLVQLPRRAHNWRLPPVISRQQRWSWRKKLCRHAWCRVLAHTRCLDAILYRPRAGAHPSFSSCTGSVADPHWDKNVLGIHQHNKSSYCKLIADCMCPLELLKLLSA